MDNGCKSKNSLILLPDFSGAFYNLPTSVLLIFGTLSQFGITLERRPKTPELL